MGIAKDTGWVTTYKSNCYYAKSREVVFDLLTPPEEIQDFVNSYNKNAGIGQVDRMWIKDDGIGLTVIGRIEVDSGD